MPNELSPIQHAVVLRRVEPELRMARFYALMIERDLFGAVRLVRAWGRIGTRGDELAQVFETEAEAEATMETRQEEAAAGVSGSVTQAT